MQVPLYRPLLPTFDKLEPYLREIDANRFYANRALLHERFKATLCRHFSISLEEMAVASSGTTSLIASILATAGYARTAGPRLCACPSYSFVATAAAARACGYTPYFIDVDPESWAVNCNHLAERVNQSSIACVLVVAPYGRTINLQEWNEFHEHWGIPVIIDAAAGFDTVSAGAVAAGRIPVCISLHATKTLSTAEGGLIIGPSDIVHRADSVVNFGFDNGRESVRPGINGKLSEYHAAVGLAEYAGWAQKRQSFLGAAFLYQQAAEDAGIAGRIIVSTTAATPYSLFLAKDQAEAKRVERTLAIQNIDYRFWYGNGIHTQPEFRNCPSEDLSVTKHLGECLVGLPFALDLTSGEARHVATAIRDALEE